MDPMRTRQKRKHMADSEGHDSTGQLAATQLEPPPQIPAELAGLAQQFVDADKHGVAGDLGRAAAALMQEAWDGSLAEKINGKRISLPDAVHRSSAALDTTKALPMSFMASVLAEKDELIDDFDNTAFVCDVVAAFSALKSLKFEGLGTAAFDHLQAALSKTEVEWQSGPHRDELLAILQFCVRFVQLSKSLKERTGECIANDMNTTATPAAQELEKPLAYDSFAGSTKDGPNRPESIYFGNRPRRGSTSCDWASLFHMDWKDGEEEDWEEEEDLEDGEDGGARRGPWLTPRMAARIHYIAICDGECMHDCHPRLPKVARQVFKRSATWRAAFRDCYRRIAMRLQKGLPPNPNCTGEEMALHNILDRAPDADTEQLDLLGICEVERLPKFWHDKDFNGVRQRSIHDDGVMEEFWAHEDNGYSDGSDEVDDEDEVELPPSEWFVPFNEENVRDHL